MKRLIEGFDEGLMIWGNAAMSRAASVSLNFSNGLGTDFGFSDNGGGYFALDDSGGNLIIKTKKSLPSGLRKFEDGHVYSKFRLGGNFNISVKYTMLSSWLEGTQIKLNTGKMVVVRSLEEFPNYHVWDGFSRKGTVRTADNSGIFEIRRIGNHISGNYNSIHLYTQSTSVDALFFNICLLCNVPKNFPGGDLAVSFEILSITADYFVNLRAPIIPVPGQAECSSSEPA